VIDHCLFQLSSDVAALKQIVEDEKSMCANLVDRVKHLTAQLSV